MLGLKRVATLLICFATTTPAKDGVLGGWASGSGAGTILLVVGNSVVPCDFEKPRTRITVAGPAGWSLGRSLSIDTSDSNGQGRRCIAKSIKIERAADVTIVADATVVWKFLLAITSGNIDKARSFLSPEARKEWTVGRLEYLASGLKVVDSERSLGQRDIAVYKISGKAIHFLAWPTSVEYDGGALSLSVTSERRRVVIERLGVVEAGVLDALLGPE
jgi:hypothetical protein